MRAYVEKNIDIDQNKLQLLNQYALRKFFTEREYGNLYSLINKALRPAERPFGKWKGFLLSRS